MNIDEKKALIKRLQLEVLIEEIHTLFYYEDGKLFYRENRYGSCNRLMNKKGDEAGCYEKKSGYVTIGVHGKTYRAHHLVWLYHHGVMPTMLDHINNIRDDNRIENLRETTYQDNQRNRKDTKENGCFSYGYYIKHNLPVPEEARIRRNEQALRSSHKRRGIKKTKDK